MFPTIDSLIPAFYLFHIPLSYYLNLGAELLFLFILHPQKQYHGQVIIYFLLD